MDMVVSYLFTYFAVSQACGYHMKLGLVSPKKTRRPSISEGSFSYTKHPDGIIWGEFPAFVVNSCMDPEYWSNKSDKILAYSVSRATVFTEFATKSVPANFVESLMFK